MSSGGSVAHSLAFRVMRLCRPSFQMDPLPLRLDPADLLVGEDLFDDPLASTQLPRLLRSNSNASDADPTYRSRLLISDPYDSIGLSGLLVLPQSFGAIYLGETFCSYISINNSSNFEVRDVLIKAEIQTERQRILLLDTSKSPVESIRASGRYDFIVEHDVKELGAHTLVCTALYNDGDGERKYLPQFFKFVVSNPLSVRTKVRVVKACCVFRGACDFRTYEKPLTSVRRQICCEPETLLWCSENTFLEACIENNTKSNLFMDQVDFEPAPNWSATRLKADDHHTKDNSCMIETFKPPILIKSGGGIHNFLYQLKSSESLAQVKVEGSNVLGKLQITWRTNLGEPGRLQTQQILGTPITRKEIELQVVELPSVINLQKPFPLHLNLANQTDKELGPFEIWLSQDGLDDNKVVAVNGLQTVVLPRLEAFGSTNFILNLIATKLGVHKIKGITVFDTREKKSYEPLPELEIFVDLE